MTGKSGRTYHHGDLRRALVEAALELLQEHQGEQFTLREVARRAGVSHAAPYRHFSDKSALLAELAMVGFEKLKGELTKAISEDASFKTQFIALSKAYIDFGLKKPALYHLMFSSVLAGQKEIHLNERVMATLNLLRELLEKARENSVFKPSPLDGQIAACWSLVHGLTLLAMDGLLLPEKVGHKPIDMALDTLLEGLST